jgi:hypothetical protein
MAMGRTFEAGAERRVSRLLFPDDWFQGSSA